MPTTQQTSLEKYILIFSLLGICAYLVLRYGLKIPDEIYTVTLNASVASAIANLYQGELSFPLSLLQSPLYLVLLVGGIPLVSQIIKKFLQGDFGSDLLAGMSIVTASITGRASGRKPSNLNACQREVLETYAVRKASSVLEALAKRMPSIAHKQLDGDVSDIPTEKVKIGDTLLVLPHEICPVDGMVLEGVGSIDESYLTGEPYLMEKTSGSQVMSGAINGDSALTIRADKLVVDSRYAKITEVMRASEQHRPQLRRLGDQLGALYTPLASALAIAS
jgi:cation transport ATPase